MTLQCWAKTLLNKIDEGERNRPTKCSKIFLHLNSTMYSSHVKHVYNVHVWFNYVAWLWVNREWCYWNSPPYCNFRQFPIITPIWKLVTSASRAYLEPVGFRHNRSEVACPSRPWDKDLLARVRYFEFVRLRNTYSKLRETVKIRFLLYFTDQKSSGKVWLMF